MAELSYPKKQEVPNAGVVVPQSSTEWSWDCVLEWSQRALAVNWVEGTLELVLAVPIPCTEYSSTQRTC